MKNLKTWLFGPPAPSNWLIAAVIILSLIGFLDAVYLTAAHYRGQPPNCIIFKGCEAVADSSYSVIFGIPLALLGAVYYLAIFIMAMIFVDLKKKEVLSWAARLTLAGFLFSLYLLFLQFFIIKALCFYCLISAVDSILLFIIGWKILSARQKESLLSHFGR